MIAAVYFEPRVRLIRASGASRSRVRSSKADRNHIQDASCSSSFHALWRVARGLGVLAGRRSTPTQFDGAAVNDNGFRLMGGREGEACDVQWFSLNLLGGFNPN